MSQTIRPFIPIALYEGMIDALPAGVLVFRLDDAQDPRSLRLLFANPRAAEFIGLDPGADHGGSLEDLLPYVYTEDLPDRMAEVARSGKGRDLGDVRFDERGTILATSLFGLPDQSVGLMLEDVTDEREQEEVRMREVAELAEERFRTLAESLPQLVWIALPDGTVEYYNPQWYAYTGMKPGTTQHDRVLTHPDDRDRVVAAWAEAVRTGEPFQLEYRLERASDNAYRWFLGRALPVTDASGQVTRWVGTATDIHDRKEEEAGLAAQVAARTVDARVAAERLDAVLNSTTDLIAAVGTDLRVIAFNQPLAAAVQAVLGQPLRLGMKADEILTDPARVERSEAEWRRALAGEAFAVLQSGDYENLGKRSFETRYSPIRDADGRVTGAVCVVRDVTERENAAVAVESYAGDLRLLHAVTTAEHATRDALIEDYLRAGLSILGMEAGAYARLAPFAVRVATTTDASTYEGAALDEQAANAVLERAGTVAVANAAAEPGGAPERAGSFIGAPVYTAGEADGVLGFAAGSIRREFAAREIEIVEILAELVGHALTVEHAEAAIYRRTLEVEQRNEELEQFAYVASHDLQEPLRTISSFLQLLETRSGGVLDEKGREYVAFALDGSRRMQTLIQGLLAYSRVGTRGAAFELVDAESVMDDVLVDLGPARLESQADVRVENLPTVCADPVQMHQLFLNLVGNAIKFRAPDSTPAITVSAVREHTTPAWRFSVADNGIGLDSRAGPRVFQLFQRLHTREEYEGTGIGLALCRKIVERHGGTISYASNEAGGTTFSFTLPDRAECRDAGSYGVDR